MADNVTQQTQDERTGFFGSAENIHENITKHQVICSMQNIDMFYAKQIYRKYF